MRLVVTGAAGFIGSSLSSALLEDGHDVVGIDTFRKHYDTRRREMYVSRLTSHERFELTVLDLAADPLDGVVDGADAIFHLAGRPGVRDSWGGAFDDYAIDNIVATRRVLDAAVHHEVPRIVYASSSSVYGELGKRTQARETDTLRPRSPYGVTKLAGELLALTYQDNMGIDAVALRYFTIYGPGQRPDMATQKFIEKSLRGEEIQVFGDGFQRRDVTFIDDCVRATAAGLTLPPNVYNVAGGSVVTLNEIMDGIDAALGFRMKRIYTQAQAGDVSVTSADVSRLRAQGVDADMPLSDGIKHQVEFTRNQVAPLMSST